MPQVRHRRPNPYGYLTHNKAPCADLQLRTLLNLEKNSEVFYHLRLNITRLVNKYLDIDRCAAVQQGQLRAIETDLKQMYPDIFAMEQSEKRLYFAVRVAFQTHASRRHQSKLKHPQRTSPTPRITRSMRKNRQRKVETPETPPSISQILSQSNELRMDTDATPSTATCTLSPPIQHRALDDFLQASVPPMSHLMNSFVEFGCINGDFLLAISLWSLEGIKDFLDKLPDGPDGRRMTGMEKLILQNHFKEYFS